MPDSDNFSLSGLLDELEQELEAKESKDKAAGRDKRFGPARLHTVPSLRALRPSADQAKQEKPERVDEAKRGRTGSRGQRLERVGTSSVAEVGFRPRERVS